MKINSIGVILMTYGSATTSKDVEPFLRHVYPNVSLELIQEFKRRFDIVGSSPLVAISIDQAAALQRLLDDAHGEGTYLVEAGMLHSVPFISDAMANLKSRGASRIVGILLSPQYSPHIMSAYNKALVDAANLNGYDPTSITMAGPWGTEPKFIQMLVESLRHLRAELAMQYKTDVPVVFTTHSLPKEVVKKDPNYLDQLSETAQAVATQAGLADSDYTTAYQSAGHTPEEWLKPDLNDVVAELRQADVKGVIVVPIQFLADHLEILYDLDTAAREETESLGMHYHRLPVANTNPLFIEALSDIVLRHS
jgi:ferrochelatase